MIEPKPGPPSLKDLQAIVRDGLPALARFRKVWVLLIFGLTAQITVFSMLALQVQTERVVKSSPTSPITDTGQVVPYDAGGATVFLRTNEAALPALLAAVPYVFVVLTVLAFTLIFSLNRDSSEMTRKAARSPAFVVVSFAGLALGVTIIWCFFRPSA